jgi:lysophospholipase L1-like esterase
VYLTLLTGGLPTVAAPPAAPLPKVVLVGDSIRLGYAPLVAKRLAGRAEVISSPENAEDSSKLLAHLDPWVIEEKPDVVHLNCGLHDLKYHRARKRHQVELAAYQANLRRIVGRLQKETNASIVWATTTPIHDARHARRKTDFDRHNEAVIRYNTAAISELRQAGVVVHDLYTVIDRGGSEKLLDEDGTHYVAEGNERLAEAVAECILRQLEARRQRPPTPTPVDAAGIAAYQKAQAERDSKVPRRYREVKYGVFQPPKSAAAWSKERLDVRHKVLESLGELPPRPAALQVRFITRELRPGFTLEQVAIDNGAEGEIPALLLIPDKRQQPAPAILWLHASGQEKNRLLAPHTDGGDESLGEAFVKASYVVLAPDAFWHGGRAGRGPAGPAETDYQREQQDLFKFDQWLGRTLWGMFVRDDQIALDYLCSRPEVDNKRIGATGMSMGSTRSWWLAAVDDRIAAGVGVACLTRYQNLIAHGELRQHGIYYFAHGLLRQFDSEGVLSLIAPRPFLALTGELDAGSPADGIKVIEEKVSAVYGTLDARDRFRSVRYPDFGHVYTAAMRTEMLEWFERWLRPAHGR